VAYLIEELIHQTPGAPASAVIEVLGGPETLEAIAFEVENAMREAGAIHDYKEIEVAKRIIEVIKERVGT
jgi:hypothetical protein